MGALRLKVELHTHTDFDPQDQIDYSAHQLIDEAARQSFEVLAITCHDALQWSPSLAEYAASAGILLIPGVEATIEGKHVLIYGLEHFREPMTFKQLRALRQSHPNVFTIAPHPFFPGGSCLGQKLVRYHDCFDAIEYSHFYTRRINFNERAVRAASALNRPLLGTSDVHVLRQLGKTYTFLTVADRNLVSVATAIKAGQVELVTAPMTGRELTSIGLQMKLIDPQSVLRRLRLLSKKARSIISSVEEQ
jgi:predicted metal-dependent phosphoesterase TrpH